MDKEIQYPFAYILPYTVVRITETNREDRHFCLGCDSNMIPKALSSQRVRPHFSHKSEPCAGDTALHRTAQAIICQTFLESLNEGREYPASFPCLRCKKDISTNLAIDGSSIVAEKTVVDGTRSDIVVFQREGTPRVIIEVVVTSDFEKKEITAQRYRDSGLPILKVYPAWETLDTLRARVPGQSLVNVEQLRRHCQRCRKEVEQEKIAFAEELAAQKRAEELAEKEFQRARRKVVAVIDGIKPHPGKALKLAPITHDKFDAPLRSHTRDAAMRNANRLAFLGFVQQAKRPTLFLYQADKWRIYADLDSTDVLRMWEVDCDVALYAFGQPKSGCRECLLEAVAGKLTQFGVSIRRYFMDDGEHDHESPMER